MFLRNKMKRFLLFFAMLSLVLSSYSQLTVNNLTFDTVYYRGVCRDSIPDTKYVTYLYLQFLTNDGDTTLVVVPYRIKKTTSPKIYQKYLSTMNDTIDAYLTELSEAIDDIENHEIVNRSWSISGFDNFTYFEVDSDKISFSINIADIETNEIEVFYFEGTIDKYGDEINAIIHSEYGTFQKSEVKLELVPKIFSKNEKIHN